MLYRLGHSLQRWWGKKESKKFFGRHSTPHSWCITIYSYTMLSCGHRADTWTEKSSSFLQVSSSSLPHSSISVTQKKTTTTSGSSSSSSMFVCCKKKRRAQGLLFFSFFFALSRKEGVVGSAARAHNITEVATGWFQVKNATLMSTCRFCLNKLLAVSDAPSHLQSVFLDRHQNLFLSFLFLKTDILLLCCI